MRNTWLLLTFSTLILPCSNTHAQTWDLFAPATSGLPPRIIRDIESGNKPWLTYVLHSHGISRFNGLWQDFEDTFGAEINGGENQVIYFDPNGNLWIGRTRGIYFVPDDTLASTSPRAENRTNTFFPDAEANPPVVTAIYCDRNQVLWIGTENRGLVRFGTGKELKPSQHATSFGFWARQMLMTRSITDIVEDSRAGFIWLGTRDGIIQMSASGDSLNSFLPGLTIQGLHADTEGRLWAGTYDGEGTDRGGLYIATNPGAPSFVRLPTPLTCDSISVQHDVRDVLQDYSGTIWASTPRNVFRYQRTDGSDPSAWKAEVFPCENNWPADVTGIVRLAVDRAGFLWAASQEQGILRYNMLWEQIKLTDRLGVQSNFVNTLYLSPIDSGLYVGTEGGAAKRDTNGIWTQIPLPFVCSSIVHSFFHDPAGFLLMGVSACGGSHLAPYDGIRRRPISCSECPTDAVFSAIVKLPNDTLWLAGENDLWASRIDNITGAKSFASITSSPRLTQQKFYTLLLQDSTFVWVGTDTSGLVRYDIAKRWVDRLATVGNFASSSVRSLHFDTTGALWIGTDRGLTHLEPPFNFDSPAWHDVSDRGPVNFVFSTSKREIWFDAPNGVAHYSPEAGVTEFPHSTQSGPAGTDVHAGLSLMENGKESFWFGTTDGISVFHGDLIPPDTRITRPSISDKNFTFIAPNTLLLTTGSLFLQYEGGDNFTTNQNLYFQTAFGKANEPLRWGPFTQERAILLHFQESGIYHFSVRTRDQSGNLDPKPPGLLIVCDLDAPSVAITQPVPTARDSISWVPGELVVLGSVIDADLDSFSVEILDPITSARLLPAITRRDTLRADTLATFNASGLHERKIRIRVTAVDRLAHLRRDHVTVRVDALQPKLKILQPADSTQALATVDVFFQFQESHPIPKLRYFEAADSLNATEIVLTLNRLDSLFSIKAGVGSAAGKHVLTFVLSDSAGNLAHQTFVVFRVPDVGISSTSKIWESSDGVVQVLVPPGKIPLTVRISPLVAAYSDSAKLDQLIPQTGVYSIESDPDFDREATLTFFFSEAPVNSDQLAIFRQGTRNKWNRGGGRLSVENGRSALRTVIKQGGIYLVAMGAPETFQRGNVTCLPRLFSPGRDEPSPFTEVVFTLDQASPVSIHIFNTAGRRVRSLIPDGEVMSPGRHPVRWDGRDGDGKTLRSGIYIVVVQTAAFMETKTVVIQN